MYRTTEGTVPGSGAMNRAPTGGISTSRPPLPRRHHRRFQDRLRRCAVAQAGGRLGPVNDGPKEGVQAGHVDAEPAEGFFGAISAAGAGYL